jgi:hypothetical protein
MILRFPMASIIHTSNAGGPLRRRFCQLACVAMTFFTAATVTPALAQTPDAPPANTSPAARDKARVLYEEGLRHFTKKDYEQARVSLQAAWSLLRHWQIATLLGAAELNLGQYRAAAEHLGIALRTFGSDGSQAELRKIQSLNDEALQHVAALRISTDRQGAEILIDGKSAGNAPLPDPVYVEPGRRMVEARAPGYLTATSTIEANVGVQEVRVSLVPVPAGAIVGTQPSSSASHSVRPPPSASDAAAPDIQTDEPAAGRSKTPLIVGGIAAGAGVALGVVFTILANNKASEASGYQSALDGATTGGEPPCPGTTPDRVALCGDLNSANSAKDQWQHLANGSFIAAGVAAGAGLALYALLPPTRSSGHAFRAVPLLFNGSTGISVSTTW